MTIFSPKSRQAGDAEVDVPELAVVPKANLDAAVLREPFLRDVELRHDLDARRDRVAELHRRCHDVVENAVDAVPHPQLLLVGLDVDVARGLLDGRHQDHVHESDDRRFLAFARQRFRADLSLENLDIAGIGEHWHLVERLRRDLQGARAFRHRAPLGRFAAVVPLDGPDDRGLGRHHRFDVVARHELDVVHGEHVGRVGHRDRERRAGARERDDLVFLRCLRGNELHDRRIDLELGECDRGHAVLLAQQRRDLLVFHVSQLHKIEAELPPVLALVVQRILQLLGRDALLLEKEFTDPKGHGRLLILDS